MVLLNSSQCVYCVFMRSWLIRYITHFCRTTRHAGRSVAKPLALDSVVILNLSPWFVIYTGFHQVWGQDGWRLAEFFFAYLWTSTSSRLLNSQKRTWPISNHLDRTNLANKGFIIWLSWKFFLRDTAGSPERARWLYLARSGSSHSARFGSSCPLAELAI